jgi:hypothetical protein
MSASAGASLAAKVIKSARKPKPPVKAVRTVSKKGSAQRARGEIKTTVRRENEYTKDYYENVVDPNGRGAAPGFGKKSMMRLNSGRNIARKLRSPEQKPWGKTTRPTPKVQPKAKPTQKSVPRKPSKGGKK